MECYSDKPQTLILVISITYLFYDLLLFTLLHIKCNISYAISIVTMFRNTSQDAMWMPNNEIHIEIIQMHILITICRRSKWTELLLRDTFFFSNNFFASNYILQFFLLFHICVTHLNYELFGSAEKHLPSMSFWIVPWHYCDKLTGNLF